ncbi:spermatogenesis-associated protein 20 [Homalodisca vitripennis]|nr:spermatogenesis-associated protein 20 [Homalodisca vitripennis]
MSFNFPSAIALRDNNGLFYDCCHLRPVTVCGAVTQGFARYSTDMKWHVPHFEKMLYDQAQLAVVYSTAYLITQDPLYQDVVKDILTYVGRDLSHKEGGFYSAEDADSLPTTKCKEKREGAFCVWTNQEICELLDRSVAANSSIKLAQLFSFYYNVKPSGNVDPSQGGNQTLAMLIVCKMVAGKKFMCGGSCSKVVLDRHNV